MNADLDGVCRWLAHTHHGWAVRGACFASPGAVEALPRPQEGI